MPPSSSADYSGSGQGFRLCVVAVLSFGPLGFMFLCLAVEHYPWLRAFLAPLLRRVFG